jgi:NAD(P)-dependent dehydrogenase (short-subunit alcohol dehydrogenase family)
MNDSLDGKAALITGGARRVGAAIARRLHAAGASVLLHYRDSQADAAKLASELNALRAKSAAIVKAELLAPIAPRALVTAARQEFGRLDILVNNAAIDDAIEFDELDHDQWRRVMGVNLDGPFNLIKAGVPLMRRNAFGRIINLASGSVVNPMPRFVAYRASKMGLIGLTRALSHELGPDGITVNVVSPGVTATPMAAASLTEDFRNAAIARQGVKRSGLPADIAGAVAFLAGPEAEFITGQTLMVNGGAAYT